MLNMKSTELQNSGKVHYVNSRRRYQTFGNRHFQRIDFISIRNIFLHEAFYGGSIE